MSGKRTPEGAKESVIVYTDGASSGNPGPGGWGAVIVTGDGDILELGGGEPQTTNNRMEMSAAIEALRVLGQREKPITLYTDSSYLVQGITRWIRNWKRRDWLTSEKQPVLNKDLWLQLEAEAEGRNITWTTVPGHAGVPGNERADRIATGFARGREVELFCGSEADYPLDLSPPTRAAVTKSREKKRGRSGKAHAYLSLVEGVWQRHATWSECERRVKGVSNTRFQKVMSEAEIDGVLARWGVAR